MPLFEFCGHSINTNNVVWIGDNKKEDKDKYPTVIKFATGESWQYTEPREEASRKFREAEKDPRLELIMERDRHEATSRLLGERCSQLWPTLHSLKRCVRELADRLVVSEDLTTDAQARDFEMPDWLHDAWKATDVKTNPLVLAARRAGKEKDDA